ncbi:hypothetical protein D3C78_1754680 [compost metagenome]
MIIIPHDLMIPIGSVIIFLFFLFFLFFLNNIIRIIVFRLQVKVKPDAAIGFQTSFPFKFFNAVTVWPWIVLKVDSIHMNLPFQEMMYAMESLASV